MQKSTEVLSRKELDYNDLGKRVANKTFYTKKDATDVIRVFLEECVNAMREGYSIKLNGVGTVYIAKTAHRPVVGFQPNKRLQCIVNLPDSWAVQNYYRAR